MFGLCNANTRNIKYVKILIFKIANESAIK